MKDNKIRYLKMHAEMMKTHGWLAFAFSILFAIAGTVAGFLMLLMVSIFCFFSYFLRTTEVLDILNKRR